MKSIQLLLLALLASAALSKRGLGWRFDGQAQDFGHFDGSQVNWIYNWEPWRPDGTPDGFEYVAMQRTADKIDQLGEMMGNNGARILLGFNEPDIGDQANMSPGDAVSLWRDFIQPHADNGIRLGSPAISNGEGSIDWLHQFFDQCDGCSIDFVACHWYGSNIDDFRGHISQVHDNFPDKSIWVTEFALDLGASAEEQRNFWNEARDFLEGADFIERYAWFGAFRGGDGYNLIDGDGNLTELGNNYKD